MKKYSILYFLFLAILNINAQNTFNKLFSFPSSVTTLKRVIVDNDTIIGYGNSVVINPDSTTNQGVIFFQIDSSGNELNKKVHFDILGQRIAVDSYWGNIIAPTIGGYAAIASTVGRQSHLFFKLKDDLTLDFVKEYPDTVNLRNFHHSIIEAKDGYIIWGSVQRQNSTQDVIIKYVDYSGEIIWEHKFDEFITNVADIEALSDSSFLLGVYNNDFGNIYYSLVQFDLQKNFRTKWSSQNAPKDFVLRKIVALKNGGYIMHGVEEVERVFGNNILYRPILMKLDEDFNLEWKNIFGDKGNSFALPPRYNTFLDFGDDIFCAGESYVLENSLHGDLVTGVLYNFTNSGDSVWFRNHYPNFPQGERGSYGEFYGMGELSSGNLIMGGEARAIGGKYYGWVVKTKPDGCLEPLCDIDSTPTSTSDLIAIESSLTIFPNPADDNVSVTFPDKYSKGKIRIFNLLGEQLFETELTTETFLRFLTESFEQGVYFLKIYKDAENTLTQKFQIIH